MKARNIALATAAAGIALGSLGVMVWRKLSEGEVGEPLRAGMPFPTVRGITLAGRPVVIPDDLHGRVTVLVLGFDYAARFETAGWAEHLATYGDRPDLAYFQVAMISEVGPIMRRVIDRAMIRGTTPDVRAHVLTAYGDFVSLRKRLGVVGPHACTVVLGRTGVIGWLVLGAPTPEQRAALDTALTMQGIMP
jgi:hypothetical protein